MPVSRRMTALAAVGLVIAAASSTSAQGPNAVDLGKRTARSKYTLGRIVSVQELADGRLVTSDGKEGVFRIVDMNKGDVTLLGTQGDDSTAYRRASTIVKLGDDSLALFDAGGRKFLHISSHGAIAAFTPMPPRTPGHFLLTLLGGDPSGALYFTTPELIDSATRTSTGIAGIARVPRGAAVDQPVITFRTRRADQKPPLQFMPFVFRDAVAVRSDGLVARVVADTYQVIWSRDGKETGRTGPLPFVEIPIPVEEQQAIKDSSIAQMRAMTAGNGRAMTFNGPGSAGLGAGGIGGGGPVTITAIAVGGGSVAFTSGGMSGGAPAALDGARASSGGAPSGAAPTPAGAAPGTTSGGTNNAPTTFDMKAMIDKMAAQPLATFPAYKPPVPQNLQYTVMFDGAGMLWVPRDRARGDQVQTYDVIAEGKGLVGRVKVPQGVRLVGFGKGAVYFARAENGDEWLERYAAPKF